MLWIFEIWWFSLRSSAVRMVGEITNWWNSNTKTDKLFRWRIAFHDETTAIVNSSVGVLHEFFSKNVMDVQKRVLLQCILHLRWWYRPIFKKGAKKSDNLFLSWGWCAACTRSRRRRFWATSSSLAPAICCGAKAVRQVGAVGFRFGDTVGTAFTFVITLASVWLAQHFKGAFDDAKVLNRRALGLWASMQVRLLRRCRAASLERFCWSGQGGSWCGLQWDCGAVRRVPCYTDCGGVRGGVSIGAAGVRTGSLDCWFFVRFRRLWQNFIIFQVNAAGAVRPCVSGHYFHVPLVSGIDSSPMIRPLLSFVSPRRPLDVEAARAVRAWNLDTISLLS